MSAAKKTLKVTQIGSPIGRKKDQTETLIGLGLNSEDRPGPAVRHQTGQGRPVTRRRRPR